jgi:adenylate cyclase
MPQLAMGCGVNFGEVVFGNIGSSRKRELTVIGDPVNVTARLEGLTKEYGREILLGPAAAELVTDTYVTQFIDRLAVKGKTKALDLYSVIGRVDEKRSESLESYLELYERAHAACRASEFANAATLFRRCLEHWPDDKVAALHLSRCVARETAAPDAQLEAAV